MNWKKAITNPKTKRARRGAISRIAEQTGVTYGTALGWYRGQHFPDDRCAQILSSLDPTKLRAKTRSDIGKKRTNGKKIDSQCVGGFNDLQKKQKKVRK